jgi:hypothetical protein
MATCFARQSRILAGMILDDTIVTEDPAEGYR